MQSKLIDVMKRYWPNSWAHITADYNGAVPLQNWLNMNVIWRPGTPPTAAEIEAKVADYDVTASAERRQAAKDAHNAQALAEIVRQEQTTLRQLAEIALGEGDIPDAVGKTPKQRLRDTADVIKTHRGTLQK